MPATGGLTWGAEAAGLGNRMSSFLVRPRFSQTLELDPDSVRERILAHVAESGTRFEVKTFPDFICVRIPLEERKFWSPRLNLSLEPSADGRTVVHGIYGPNASFWSFYLYAGLITGSLALFSSILGFCQRKLGMTPWGLWVFGVSLAAGLALYLMAQIGQKFAAQQTFRLHQAYEAALGTSVAIH